MNEKSVNMEFESSTESIVFEASSTSCSEESGNFENKTCTEHQYSEVLKFPTIKRRILKGCCLEHPLRGCVAFSGIDMESGQLLYITEWNIKNEIIKAKGVSRDNLIKEVTKIVSKLSKLNHKNLVAYKYVMCVKKKASLVIYLAQEFIQGTRISSLSAFGLIVESLSMIAKNISEALIFLENHNISHSNLHVSSVFLDNRQEIRLTDFALVPYLRELLGYPTKSSDDVPALGAIIKSLTQKPNSLTNAFIQDCCTNPEVSKLSRHPFLTQISKNDSAHEPRLGKDFDTHEIVGKGGFGSVLKVYNKLDSQMYAIKKITIPATNSQASLMKSIDEVKLLSRLNHRNVVRYYTSWIGDSESIDNKPAKTVIYIQMELCENKTLRTAIDEGLHTDEDRLWRFVHEILKGLSHIHAHGIIHRDLKPENIFLDSNDQVKIGDFGLAKTYSLAPQLQGPVAMHASKQEITDRQTRDIGTVTYMAPELKGIASDATSKYNAKVDIYSLGIIVFEMCQEKCYTAMERYKILSDLRTPDIIMPEQMLNNNQFIQHVELIRWLLKHDPSKRPTADNLLDLRIVQIGLTPAVDKQFLVLNGYVKESDIVEEVNLKLDSILLICYRFQFVLGKVVYVFRERCTDLIYFRHTFDDSPRLDFDWFDEERREFVEHEAQFYKELMSQIHETLMTYMEIVNKKGKYELTNEHKVLLETISENMVPKDWQSKWKGPSELVAYLKEASFRLRLNIQFLKFGKTTRITEREKLLWSFVIKGGGRDYFLVKKSLRDM